MFLQKALGRFGTICGGPALHWRRSADPVVAGGFYPRCGQLVTQVQTCEETKCAPVDFYRSPFAEPDREAWITQLDGTKIGLTSLSAYVFAAPPRTDILHRVVVWQLAKRRAGTASTKNRAEVSGSGRKISPQKGTGRARHGDRLAPLFRHGGVAHGPKPRSYDYPLPVRVRKLGLRVALSVKFAQGYLSVVDKLAAPSTRTEDMQAMLEKRGASEDNTMLLVGGEALSPNVVEASLDLPHCQAICVKGLNVYDIMAFKETVLSLDAIRYLEDFLYSPERKKR